MLLDTLRIIEIRCGSLSIHWAFAQNVVALQYSITMKRYTIPSVANR